MSQRNFAKISLERARNFSEHLGCCKWPPSISAVDRHLPNLYLFVWLKLMAMERLGSGIPGTTAMGKAVFADNR